MLKTFRMVFGPLLPESLVITDFSNFDAAVYDNWGSHWKPQNSAPPFLEI
jgi:hypothetical protein